MKHKESLEISKSVWLMAEQAKSAAAQNIVTAVARGDLKIERSQLPKLISLLNSSIEQGFVAGSKEFDRKVNEALDKIQVAKPGKKA